MYPFFPIAANFLQRPHPPSKDLHLLQPYLSRRMPSSRKTAASSAGGSAAGSAAGAAAGAAAGLLKAAAGFFLASDTASNLAFFDIGLSGLQAKAASRARLFARSRKPEEVEGSAGELSAGTKAEEADGSAGELWAGTKAEEAEGPNRSLKLLSICFSSSDVSSAISRSGNAALPWVCMPASPGLIIRQSFKRQSLCCTEVFFSTFVRSFSSTAISRTFAVIIRSRSIRYLMQASCQLGPVALAGRLISNFLLWWQLSKAFSSILWGKSPLEQIWRRQIKRPSIAQICARWPVIDVFHDMVSKPLTMVQTTMPHLQEALLYPLLQLGNRNCVQHFQPGSGGDLHGSKIPRN